MKFSIYDNIKYTEFETPQEYNDWLLLTTTKDSRNEIYNYTSIDDLHPILYYQGHGYIKINNYLRNAYPKHNTDIAKDIFKKAQIIQNIINTSIIEKNLITYRYINIHRYKKLMKQKKKSIQHKQFVSTTAVPSYCKDQRYNTGKIIKILINKNMNAIGLFNLNKNCPECEIILPYMTSMEFLFFENKVPVFKYNYTQVNI